jgi:lipoyl(octanoyl) transferase
MQQVICKFLNIQNYQITLAAMQEFTKKRNCNTLDEIWFLEHEPVFTLGKAGLDKHLLFNNNIPVIRSDRGGQITYHAPGQLVIYFLIDLIRKSLSLKQLIDGILQAMVEFLKIKYNLDCEFNREFPGIYINKNKICSIGLKILKGCSYHGISFNLDMDLKPFTWINPCGINGLNMTQLKDCIIKNRFDNSLQNNINVEQVANLLKIFLLKKLGYTECKYDAN